MRSYCARVRVVDGTNVASGEHVKLKPQFVNFARGESARTVMGSRSE